MIDIDLVYLWVDGNDPQWIAKRNASIESPTGVQENCKGRYADSGELKYSLRSVEKYAPWIRKIFIVTDNQIPQWLDATNPKIQIVDHTEILPAECLPCFNSVILEHHIHKIPGLSEHFLYANDDTLINQPVTPDTFFAKDLLPKIRLIHRPFKKWDIKLRERGFGKPLKNYPRSIHNAARLVEKKYGTYYTGKPHHNIDAYLKSNIEHVREIFSQEIGETLHNHMRSPNDIQRVIYSYVALAEKRGHLSYISRRLSFRFRIHNHSLYRDFARCNPILFCMNDTEHANDDDRRFAVNFLQGLFPEKSQFEK